MQYHHTQRGTLTIVVCLLLAALDAVITQQAQIIAFVDDYKLLMIATLAVIPLLIVFRTPHSGPDAEPVVVAD